MSKEWKPSIEESNGTRRRRRVARRPRENGGYRSRRGSAWPTLSIDRRDIRLVLMVGIFLGLIFAWVPNLLQRMPEPDKPIPRSVERRIIAERTRERLGNWERPIGETPAHQDEYRDAPDAWDTGPDYDVVVTNRAAAGGEPVGM